MNADDVWARHHGQVGMLWLNGPSLLSYPDSYLRSIPSVGVNGIYLHPRILPDYYVAVDAMNYTDLSEVRLRDVVKFLNSPRLDAWPDDGYLIRWRQVPDGLPMGDLNKGIPLQGVAEAALQVMLWLGFRAVIMVGADWDRPGEHWHDHVAGDNNAGTAQAWAKAVERVRDCGMEVKRACPSSYGLTT